VLEELEVGELEFETVGEFLAEIKKEFRGGEEELVKIAELKKLEQGGRTMEEFVQKFKRTVRGSGYEGRPLVEEFKRGMMLWDALDMNNFYFIFILFSDFIGILFSFSFLLDEMKRHMTLQSHDMSHDVIS